MSQPASLIVEVEHSIASGSVKQRLNSLRRVTDLFLAGSGRYNEQQVGVFDEVLVRLSSKLENAVRAELSRRLSNVADAPLRTVSSLALDSSIEVAAPMLAHSERVTEPDLIKSASTQSQLHLFAISQRRKLGENVTDILVERGDRRVVHSVARNAGAEFSDKGFRKLVKRAGDDQALAEIVGLRADIPRHHFLKLLQAASATVRERLSAANPQSVTMVQNAVTDIAEKVGSDLREASKTFARVKAAAKRRYTTQQLSETDIHTAANAEQFDKTAANLALLGKVPIDLVERALVDKNPEVVLVLAKAAGCSRFTVKSLLLMKVAERGMSAHDLERTLENYEKLSIDSAQRVLRYYAERRLGGVVETSEISDAPPLQPEAPLLKGAA